MNEVTLLDISQHLNISPCYFSKLFKSIFGINYRMFLNKMRIDKAESIIKNEDKKIIEVALECGFESIRTFNRVFKSIKGFAPSELLNKKYEM